MLLISTQQGSIKQCTKIDPNDAKVIALTTLLSKLEKKNAYVIATVQSFGVNRTQTLTNTKGRDPNKSSFEEINNLEYWRVKKSKDNITRDGQDWYWCPN